MYIMIAGDYEEGAAIAIIVLNTLSLLCLALVMAVYLLRWKIIASFPMRLVNCLTN